METVQMFKTTKGSGALRMTYWLQICRVARLLKNIKTGWFSQTSAFDNCQLSVGVENSTLMKYQLILTLLTPMCHPVAGEHLLLLSLCPVGVGRDNPAPTGDSR